MDETIRRILRECSRIAVVGLSDKPWRPSHRVARYLLEHGYDVIPVNPQAHEILGRRCYPALIAVPGPVDLVDIFRRAEHIPGIVDEAIRIGARAVWMQSGLADEASAERARRAGLWVVMDRCIMIEHGRYGAEAERRHRSDEPHEKRRES
jgi:predicted CoA-binding protein